MTHDPFTGTFTGTAGSDRNTIESRGFSRAVDGRLHGGPAPHPAPRLEPDRFRPVAWFLMTFGCLLILAALTKPALALALWLIGVTP